MTKDFLWVEKWAPETVEELILPKHIKDYFLDISKSGQLNQNLILQGSQGCGKTQTIKTLCKITKQEVLFLNGSSEGRYLDTIRNKVITFGTSVSLFGNKKKVVFFDEFDGTTNDVMLCLRGVIEQLHNNVCFIFTCNNLNKIITPIQSRCVLMNFTPISKEDKPQMMMDLFKRMSYILSEESVEFDKKVLVEMVAKYFPDTRKLINELQRYSSTGELEISAIGGASNKSLDELMVYLKERNFKEVKKWTVQNIDNDITKLYRQIYESLSKSLVSSSLPAAIMLLADYQYKSSFVADLEVNLLAFLIEIMTECEFV